MSTSMTRWFVIPLNPEGWAVGPLGVARKNGKLIPYMGRNQQLAAYKEAVSEEFARRYGQLIPTDREVELRIYAWQRIDEYSTASGRKSKDKAADLTNIVKATEDAVQGILIANDNKVMAQRNVIVDRAPAIEGALIICVADWDGLDPSEIPDHVWNDYRSATAPQPLFNRQQLVSTGDLPF
jgi:Holliday junction resolvase RusA-like endonuclease